MLGANDNEKGGPSAAVRWDLYSKLRRRNAIEAASFRDVFADIGTISRERDTLSLTCRLLDAIEERPRVGSSASASSSTSSNASSKPGPAPSLTGPGGENDSPPPAPSSSTVSEKEQDATGDESNRAGKHGGGGGGGDRHDGAGGHGPEPGSGGSAGASAEDGDDAGSDAGDASTEATGKKKRTKRKKVLRALRGGGSSSASANAALEAQVQDLKSELRASLKANIASEQNVARLSGSVRKLRETCEMHAESLADLMTRLSEASDATAALRKLVSEKDAAIELLRQENDALRAAAEAARADAEAARKSEEQLVARMVQDREQLATLMNEVNAQRDEAERAVEAARIASAAAVNVPETLSASLATGGFGTAGTIPSQQSSVVRPAHFDAVNALAFDGAGSVFASASTDATVALWDASPHGGGPGSRRHRLAKLGGWSQGVLSVAFAPGGGLLAAGGSDGTARVYDVRAATSAAGDAGAGSAKHVLTGHRNKVQACAFTADGRNVVTGSHDRTIVVWDVNTGSSVRTIICLSSCNDVDVSSSGNVIYSAHQDGHVRMWDLRSGSAAGDIVGYHRGAATCASLSSDMASIATVSREDGLIRIFDARTQKPRVTLSSPNFQVTCNWHSACFSPCTNYVASGSHTGTVLIWRASDGRLEKELTGHDSPVYSVAWGPNIGGLVSGDKNKTIIAWE